MKKEPAMYDPFEVMSFSMRLFYYGRDKVYRGENGKLQKKVSHYHWDINDPYDYIRMEKHTTEIRKKLGLK